MLGKTRSGTSSDKNHTLYLHCPLVPREMLHPFPTC